MFRATALILPSIWYENFPRVIVEAFACGLPVIATRVGAITEIIEDGVTGILVNPGNASELAAKIQWASSNRAKMAEMGLKARKTYETLYTPVQNYERLISIYRSVLGRSHIQ
jgi:glycosyltransferase involved in cell wall biosynthesis